MCILTKVGISSFLFKYVFKTFIDILHIKFITHNIFQNHSKYSKTYIPKNQVMAKQDMMVGMVSKCSTLLELDNGEL